MYRHSSCKLQNSLIFDVRSATVPSWTWASVLCFCLCGCEAGQDRHGFMDVGSQWGIVMTTSTGTAEKRFILESTTGGVALFDYDNDGDLDIYLVNGMDYKGPEDAAAPHSTLYRNDGDGDFLDIGVEAGVAHVGWGMGCTAVDYNGDGWVDLYVTAYGPNALYKNEGAGRFSNVASQAGIDHEGWSTGAAFGDFDGDGDLDLYLANYIQFELLQTRYDPILCAWYGIEVFCGPRGLTPEKDLYFRNEGEAAGWAFSEATASVGLDGPAHYGLGVVAGDWDGDADLDLYVANDAGANLLWRNDAGHFSQVGTAASVALSQDGREQSGMGIAAGDYDGNGTWDLFVTNFSHDNNTLYRNEGEGHFLDTSFITGVGQSSLAMLGWGTGFFDYDNDGDDDLFVANGHVYPQVDVHDLGTTYKQENQLYENVGDGAFVEVSRQAGPGLQVQESSRGTAFGDLDNDGDVDVVVWNMDAPPTVLRNDGGNANHWLIVELVGKGGNRQAVGGQVSVYLQGKRQMRQVRSGTGYLSQDDTRLHFGLGGMERADSLVVRWPDGRREVLKDVAGDRIITVEQGRE